MTLEKGKGDSVVQPSSLGRKERQSPPHGGDDLTMTSLKHMAALLGAKCLKCSNNFPLEINMVNVPIL